MKKSPVILFVTTVFILMLIFSGCAAQPSAPPAPTPAPSPAPAPTPAPTPAAPIKLSFVSFLAANNFEYAAWKPIFIDVVNERGKGKVTIDVKGGPEVIPTADLALAVSQGQVDMCMIASGLATGVIIGMDMIRLSEISAQEERANGTYDYIREICGKANLYFIGRQQPTKSNFFYLMLKKQANKPDDFKGLKIACSPSFFGMVQGIGAVPKPVAMPDYYTSLESGVVDGIATALSTWAAMSLNQVSPFCLDTPFYKNQVGVLCNLNTWNKLPDDVKKLISDVQVEAEQKWVKIYEDGIVKTTETTKQKGATFYTLSPADTEWFMKAVIDGSWADDVKRFPPDMVQKMKSLISK